MSEELDQARAELLAAKDSGDEEAKQVAAEKVAELRSAERAGRTGNSIGGDAVKVSE